MMPYNQPGGPSERPLRGGSGGGPPEGPPPGSTGGVRPGGTQPIPPVSEMSVSTPTLLRVSLGGPQERVPIGPDDYVLDSVYDYQIDTWELLVLVQPREDDGTDEADDDR